MRAIKRIQSLIQSLISLIFSVDVKCHEKIQNHIRHERSESAREQRMALYKSEQ